jgi:hypothetical protein
MGMDPLTIGLIGGIGSSLIGADAAGDAADTQAAAAGESNALQKYQYDTTRKDQAPWRAAGEASLNRLMGLLNDGSLTSKFAGQNVQNEPGYAFGMKQGIDTAKMLGSRSGGFGGDVLKAGTRYAQDYAGTKYNDAFNRFQTEGNNAFNKLSTMAGFGNAANQQMQVAGQNYANNVGNNLMSNANAQGAAGIAQGNIYGNALNQGIAYGNRNNWWQTPVQSDPYGGGYQYDSPYDLYPGP